MVRKFIVECIETIDSTNLELKRRVRNGLTGTDVLVAQSQTAGRGRLGRSFESLDKTGLYMSVLFKVDFNKPETMLLTAGAAVAVTRAIKDVTKKESFIKWVNDIYIDGKKVCGILAEAVTSDKNETYVIIGIGVNVAMKKDTFSEEVANIAGALYENEPDIEDIKNKLADNIVINIYDIYENLDGRSFLEEYRSRSLVIGKEIKYYMNETWKYGKAVDIDDDGALVVESEGKTELLNTGEITLRLT